MIVSPITFIRKNKITSSVALFLLFILNNQTSFAQAGIYDETDIEFQSMFIEAQLEKVKGNTDKQISILKNVIKRDKSSHASYFELAKAYIELKDYESAIKNAKKAIQFNPSNSYYLELLADTYERDEQFQSANDTYQKLIAIDAKKFEYHDKMAFNQMVIGKPNNAVTTLQNWQSQNGISERVSLKIFDIYNGLGDTKNALSTLENLTLEFPNNTRFLIKKARYLLFIGEKDQALTAYSKVLEIDPQNQTALLAKTQEKIKSNPSNSNLSELNVLFDNENISIDAKIKELMPYMAKMPLSQEGNAVLKTLSEKLVNAYPNEAKSFAVSGDVLFYMGKFLDSEKAYSKAIDLDDRKYIVWDQWILNQWELEDYTKMENVALDAIDLFPNQVNAYLFNAMASKQNNDIDNASEMLEEASFISGDNPKFEPFLTIVSHWINLDNLTSDQISNGIKNINEKEITSAIHFELLGDIYKHISNVAKSKSCWENAIKLGGNASRINKKIGV